MLKLPKETDINVIVSKQKIKQILTQKDVFKFFDKEVSRCYLVNEISVNNIQNIA